MAIERINVSSSEMKRVLKFIKIMTKSMKFDENMKNVNWKKCRIRNNFFYMLMPKQKGVKYKKVKLGSVKALLSTFGKPDEKNIILYLHGGGFVTGSAFVCKSYCSTLAKYSKCMVYAAEYSLAPEKPFPAGFNDCCNAFEEIVKLHPNAKIALVGESAGGNYSIALALKYKEKVSCVIANSPAVDFSSKVEYDKNEDNDFIERLRQKTDKEIWKAVSITTKDDIIKAESYKVDTLLLDGGNPGSGETFAWQLINELPKDKRIFLAGGINENNVLQGIERVSPYGIDVSSGVETITEDGIRNKDKVKMERLIKMVREV